MRRRQCTDPSSFRYRGATQDKLELARSIRACPTAEERALWNALRARQLGGFKFRRQHIIAGFIADFYCSAAYLVVEVDGSSHRGRENYDADRDQIFAQLGVAVMRVSNDAIHHDLGSVLDAICDTCKNRSSRPRIRGAG